MKYKLKLSREQVLEQHAERFAPELQEEILKEIHHDAIHEIYGDEADVEPRIV